MSGDFAAQKRASEHGANEIARSDWYVSALEHLVKVVQELSQAKDLDSVMAIVRKAARDLTGADGATFVLRDGNQCYYAEENAITPLWKGQRFPMRQCISGWVMLNAQPAIIEDIYQDPRIPADAYRPTFVKSLLMVPIRKNNPIGAIGNYWAHMHSPSEDELSILQTLANFTCTALESIDLNGQLQEKIHALNESNMELSRFAWIAAHDLKSPLRAIDNLSKWIEEDARESLGEASKKHFQTLRHRVNRMGRFLDDILDYARIENKLLSHPGEEVSGEALIEDVLALIELPAGFRLDVKESFKSAHIPRTPLLQILSNLINNAFRHHHNAAGVITVGCNDDEGRYIFYVRDDGPGIDPQYHEKIFDMFQTLKSRDAKEGSGMGLAIVKKTLTVYGQKLWLESQPGQGSTFFFTWPKNAMAESEAGSQAHAVS